MTNIFLYYFQYNALSNNILTYQCPQFVFSAEFIHYHKIIWEIENHILIINISPYIRLFLSLFFKLFFHVFCCISLIYWTSLIACAIVSPHGNHVVGSSENHPITCEVVVILTEIVIYVRSNIFFSTSSSWIHGPANRIPTCMTLSSSISASTIDMYICRDDLWLWCVINGYIYLYRAKSRVLWVTYFIFMIIFSSFDRYYFILIITIETIKKKKYQNKKQLLSVKIFF